MPGGSDVEVTQNCDFYNCNDSVNPYPYVYAIRHADFHGSHVFGSCADKSPSGHNTCTYNTYYFGHITDSFGNVEAAVNCGFGCNSNEEPGSFDGSLEEFSGNTGYLLFPTRSYIQSETRFMHPEPHSNSVTLFDPQTWNSYGYTRGNPLMLRDPFGTQDEDSPDSGDDFSWTDFTDQFFGNPFGSLTSSDLSSGYAGGSPTISAFFVYYNGDVSVNVGDAPIPALGGKIYWEGLARRLVSTGLTRLPASTPLILRSAIMQPL
ncbi:MAG: hypothetical protein WB558_11800 [Terriglobales bacterium]